MLLIAFLRMMVNPSKAMNEEMERKKSMEGMEYIESLRFNKKEEVEKQ